jgi:hypothetical protein
MTIAGNPPRSLSPEPFKEYRSLGNLWRTFLQVASLQVLLKVKPKGPKRKRPRPLPLEHLLNSSVSL